MCFIEASADDTLERQDNQEPPPVASESPYNFPGVFTQDHSELKNSVRVHTLLSAVEAAAGMSFSLCLLGLRLFFPIF